MAAQWVVKLGINFVKVIMLGPRVLHNWYIEVIWGWGGLSVGLWCILKVAGEIVRLGKEPVACRLIVTNVWCALNGNHKPYLGHDSCRRVYRIVCIS